MLSVSRTRLDRVQASDIWDRSFRYAYARAVAETLVQIISSLDQPTIGDVVRFCGPGLFDFDDLDVPEVRVGDFFGLPGEGPGVSAVVGALEGLDRVELDIAIEQRLSDLLG